MRWGQVISDEHTLEFLLGFDGRIIFNGAIG
jgi:hypothetical protein